MEYEHSYFYDTYVRVHGIPQLHQYMRCNRATPGGARVRDKVRGVTAYRLSPTRLKTTRDRVRDSSAEDSGSGLGLERVYTYPGDVPGTGYLLFLLHTLPVRKGATYDAIAAQSRQDHLHAMAIAPSMPDAAALPASANCCCCLPSFPFNLPASFASLNSFSEDTFANISECILAASRLFFSTSAAY